MIEAVAPEFATLVPPDQAPQVLYDGCTFTEGPVWFGDLRCLVWSDIPNSRMLRTRS